MTKVTTTVRISARAHKTAKDRGLNMSRMLDKMLLENEPDGGEAEMRQLQAEWEDTKKKIEELQKKSRELFGCDAGELNDRQDNILVEKIRDFFYQRPDVIPLNDKHIISIFSYLFVGVSEKGAVSALQEARRRVRGD